ncbi:MAG: sugar nucleotide-binding protein [Actinomycetota bacterium]|nr:sugar nucleotide-binding protein [Actinomycetota bacterium]
MSAPAARGPRVLVTGASGYLGRRLVELAARRAEVVGTHLSSPARTVEPARPMRLDVTAEADVRNALSLLRPAAVIHAAAANPGADEDAVATVNPAGARAVAGACGALGIRLVHVSTDVVHDGRRAPYADDAAPSPLDRYGAAKAEAEAVVAERCPAAAIVRTSLIYGLERMDRGTEGFARRLADGQRLQLFTDVVRQPVFVDALADALVALALDDRDERGTINVVGARALSRAEFGRLMLDHWQVDGRDRIDEVTAADRFDHVPLDLRMRRDRASALGYPQPGVDEVLADAARDRA